jgi:hypothetical protein
LASGYSGTCTIGRWRQASGLHLTDFVSFDIRVSNRHSGRAATATKANP